MPLDVVTLGVASHLNGHVVKLIIKCYDLAQQNATNNN